MNKEVEEKISAEKKAKMGEITKRYRAEACMSVAEFRRHLCEKLKDMRRQNVYQWENGKRAVPKYFLALVALVYDAEDWRYQWAVECLQVIDPETWGVSIRPESTGYSTTGTNLGRDLGGEKR